MLKTINSVLADFKQEYIDSRTQHFQVEATALGGELCTLSGMVLDTHIASLMTARLEKQFPGIKFDSHEIKILRRDQNQHLTVMTNLTGFYAGPFFLAEMMSQVLNGDTLEILDQHEKWVYTRQPDGYLGWVYRPYLADLPPQRPTHLIWSPTSPLFIAPSAEADWVTRVMAGTAVHLLIEKDGWAKVKLAGSLQGWLRGHHIRPLDLMPKNEAVRRDQLIHDGRSLIGIPYLWGGCTAMGIDCSGLVQLLHRLVGVRLPRDADMQFAAGLVVEPPFQPGDLLFFGSHGNHRRISHVAVSLAAGHILHSSRSRNGVYVEELQKNHWLRDNFRGARTFLAGQG